MLYLSSPQFKIGFRVFLTVAALLVLGMAHGARAYYSGSWSVSQSGTVLSITPWFSGTQSGTTGYAIMSRGVDPTNFGDYCGGGGSQTNVDADFLDSLLINTNIATDWGIGTGPCTDPGTYYALFFENNSPFPLYAVYSIYWTGSSFITASSTGSGSGTPGVPAPQDVKIWSPEYGSTTATTTFDVQIQYKTPLTLDFRPTTTEYYEIRDALTGEIQYKKTRVLAANSSENVVRVDTVTTTPGSKFLRAAYLTEGGLPYSNVDEIFFNVATNTYFAATGLLTPRATSTDLSQINCSLFDVGCQFQKALTFLFKPTAASMDRFMSLWQGIAQKKPFGYVFTTIDALSNLTATGTAAFSFGTIPFMDAIFTPIKVAVGSILWGLFALWWVRARLSTLDI